METRHYLDSGPDPANKRSDADPYTTWILMGHCVGIIICTKSLFLGSESYYSYLIFVLQQRLESPNRD